MAEGQKRIAGKDDTSAVARTIAAVVTIGFVLGLLVLLVQANAHLFYRDDQQQQRAFLWPTFIFFLTKGPAAQISGASVFGLAGSLLAAGAKLFRSRAAVSLISWTCLAGAVLTLALWICITQDPEVLGEVTGMAGSAFPKDPTTRLAQSEHAIDVLLGSFFGWWLWTLGSILGLKAADKKGLLARVTKLFSHGK